MSKIWTHNVHPERGISSGSLFPTLTMTIKRIGGFGRTTEKHIPLHRLSLSHSSHLIETHNCLSCISSISILLLGKMSSRGHTGCTWGSVHTWQLSSLRQLHLNPSSTQNIVCVRLDIIGGRLAHFISPYFTCKPYYQSGIMDVSAYCKGIVRPCI